MTKKSGLSHGCVFATRNIFILMDFSEILNFLSRDKKKKSLKKAGNFIEPFSSGSDWVKPSLNMRFKSFNPFKTDASLTLSACFS
jgi:hypothetical protein